MPDVFLKYPCKILKDISGYNLQAYRRVVGYNL